jgi:hypothetical protein
MSGRRKPHYQQPGSRVAPAWQRPRPVLFVRKPLYLFLPYLPDVPRQPRTQFALGYLRVEPAQPVSVHDSKFNYYRNNLFITQKGVRSTFV